jgi:hypothetical protein
MKIAGGLVWKQIYCNFAVAKTKEDSVAQLVEHGAFSARVLGSEGE